MSPPVLFRADGGPGIGEGHLMRSLALAQQLRDQGRHVHLVTTRPDAPGAAEWRKECRIFAVPEPSGGTDDARACAAIAAFMDVAWVVVDGYELGIKFQRALKAAGLKLVVLDDTGARVAADVVVNPNLGAEARCTYSGAGRSLLGADYALLRRSVRQSVHAEPGAMPRLLVSFGGDDREGRGLATLQLLAAAPRTLGVTLVWSGRADGIDAARALATPNVTVVPRSDLAPLMAHADLALCAGGTTTLELAHLGVPAVVLPIADNQRPGAQALAEAGCAQVVADLPEAVAAALALAADPARRSAMGARGRALVDGKGVERVAALITPE